MNSSPLDSAITQSSNTYKSGSTFFMHKRGLLANKKSRYSNSKSELWHFLLILWQKKKKNPVRIKLSHSSNIMHIDIFVGPHLCHSIVLDFSHNEALSSSKRSGSGVKDCDQQGNQLSAARYFRSSH